MKRRTFLQTVGLTSLSICSAGLVTGCKSTVAKSVSAPANLYQAEFIQILTNMSDKPMLNRINKAGYLKIDKAAFLLNGALAVAYQNKVIGVIKLNEKNFAASLLVCPHRGCAVEFIAPIEQQQNSYVCPCHGARFSETGQVTRGPATESLTTFITHTDQSFIYIHLIDEHE